MTATLDVVKRVMLPVCQLEIGDVLQYTFALKIPTGCSGVVSFGHRQ